MVKRCHGRIAKNVVVTWSSNHGYAQKITTTSYKYKAIVYMELVYSTRFWYASKIVDSNMKSILYFQ